MPGGSSDEYSDDDDLMIFPLTDLDNNNDNNNFTTDNNNRHGNNDHRVPDVNSSCSSSTSPPFSPIDDDDDDDDDDEEEGGSDGGGGGNTKKKSPLGFKIPAKKNVDKNGAVVRCVVEDDRDGRRGSKANNVTYKLNRPPTANTNPFLLHQHHHPTTTTNTTTNTPSSPRLNWMKAIRLAKTLKDPWEKFHITDYPSEFAIRHRYHALHKQWITDRVEVKMEDEPFDQGAMRCCYRIKKLPTFGKHKDWQHAHNYVAKSYISEGVPRDVYFSDVRLQMDAKLWGEEYSRHNPPKKIDIVQMCVLEFTSRPPGKQFYHLEHFIEGHYTKYNSNSGFVDENLRLTPQTFSHFTFERSGHQLIVVDIQGVGDLWTDPQIHSVDDIYGDGNLGTKGMALFFQSHKCNSICESLGLSKFDLAPSEVNLNNDVYNGIMMKRLIGAGTRVRGDEEPCIPASPVERHNLIDFLVRRSRNVSMCSSTMMSEDVSDDDGIVEDDSPPSSMYGSMTQQHNNNHNNQQHHNNNNNHSQQQQQQQQQHNMHNNHITTTTTTDDDNNHNHMVTTATTTEDQFDCESPMLFSPPVRKPRQRFYSESEDCMSLTKAEEQCRLQFEFENRDKARPACVEHELNLRNLQQVRKLCDSVLGQIHHDLAKYHEMGRFCVGKNLGEVDLEAALFHERFAADLGVKEAMVTLASIYLDMPREVLINVNVQKNDENMRKGFDYMLMAAGAGDRGAMLYVAHAYESGEVVGDKGRSPKKAVQWYECVLNMTNEDEVGEYDATGDSPPYDVMARVAGLYLAGEGDLEKDASYAGDLYTRAAENATQAMKGRLANKYYALAEEAWSLVEEE